MSSPHSSSGSIKRRKSASETVLPFENFFIRTLSNDVDHLRSTDRIRLLVRLQCLIQMDPLEMFKYIG